MIRLTPYRTYSHIAMDDIHQTPDHTNNNSQMRLPDNETGERSLIIWPFVAECVAIKFKTPEELRQSHLLSDTINIPHYSPTIAADWRNSMLVMWDPVFTPPAWQLSSRFRYLESIEVVHVNTLAKEIQTSLVQSLAIESSQPHQATARTVYESYEDDETGLTIEMKGSKVAGFVWSVTNAHKNLPPGIRIYNAL